MPLQDTITARDTSGWRTVVYRDANGNSWDAVIVGPGSGSGYKIRLTSDANRIVDNVAKATATHGTNANGKIHPRQK